MANENANAFMPSVFFGCMYSSLIKQQWTPNIYGEIYLQLQAWMGVRPAQATPFTAAYIVDKFSFHVGNTAAATRPAHHSSYCCLIIPETNLFFCRLYVKQKEKKKKRTRKKEKKNIYICRHGLEWSLHSNEATVAYLFSCIYC